MFSFHNLLDLVNDKSKYQVFFLQQYWNLAVLWNLPQHFEMTLTGSGDGAPLPKIYDENGRELTGMNRILTASDVEQDGASRQTTAKLNINTDADWFNTIRNGRGTSNHGTTTFTIKGTAEGSSSEVTIPVTVNYRYEGLDMTAKAIKTLPQGYEETPENITE